MRQAFLSKSSTAGLCKALLNSWPENRDQLLTQGAPLLGARSIQETKQQMTKLRKHSSGGVKEAVCPQGLLSSSAVSTLLAGPLVGNQRSPCQGVTDLLTKSLHGHLV